ncbi:AAA-domain-containing protein [Laetiporus sulphureus 93-53]|uniref:Vesicular-fusion protein SEC18 n=1 Tax=Laetiporus sulphureus 93-53 TaxID=1314785 RepID=A0A165DU12_9APHY|nr:AAA-domain-containing protein [Laetiporus sulphureus 93-53]KZT05630.1 AAA-domain-containing protein [Laetiporus sulphureus 93-53]
MSFFRSSNNPTPPQPPYSRLPASGSAAHFQREHDAGSRSQRIQTPRYDDGALAEKRGYDQRTHARMGSTFVVASAPSDALALSNCLIVHPSDFTQGQHVLVKQAFPLTTKHDDTGRLSSGSIGASAVQRQWIGLSLTGDEVTVEPLSPSPPYLQSVDIEVGFLRRGHEIAEQFSADEMSHNFLKAFSGIVLAVGEILVFEFHGQNLKATVKALHVVDLPNQPGKASHAPTSYGVVMERTDVTFLKASDSAIKIKSSAKKAPPNAILAPNFRFEDMGIGGLDEEFGAIFRRAFASRVFPPALVEKLGIQHVKGILLYGPPGTGKTLLARQIGKMLNAREPKIVNGPEILNKYVGASEENIRKLFEDAEKEYKAKHDESGLHIIIFDELDAICKQRGSTSGGTGVGDSVVNQLLSKMDGVDQLNNVLIIGMTNRLDMIDEALLRPGRLEVHMEISLPDEHGRLQILNIHTAKMRANKVMADDVNLEELAALTKNFSGAEINGLVKSATSFAFSRHVKVGTLAGISDDIENLRVSREDFMNALEEVQPAYGVAKEELEQVVQNGIIHYSQVVDDILRSGKLFVDQVRTSTRTPLVSILLHGPPGAGKTALAATIAQASQYPFMKLLSPDDMVGFSEAMKVAAINKTFSDSYKSPLSVIVVDNLERLLDFTPIGPRFSNSVLQALMVLFGRRPPKGRRLFIIATSSLRPVLTDLGLSEAFDSELRVPPISSLRAVEHVLDELELFPSTEERRKTIRMLEQAGFGSSETDEDETMSKLNIGIKKLLSTAEMARQEPEAIGERLTQALMGLGM